MSVGKPGLANIRQLAEVLLIVASKVQRLDAAEGSSRDWDALWSIRGGAGKQ
jgi:hypothetical protein